MKNFIALFFTFSFLSGFAQLTTPPADKKIEFPSIIPPSPTVANLMHFEEVPINNYTGQPDISISIYSKQLAPDLTLPIALKYTTLGIRLHERSGWLGTGWSLECGGTISRTIKGYADETQKAQPHNITGISHNPDYWNYDNLTDYKKNEFLWNVNGTRFNKYDSEPDIYQISVLGINARFMIGAGMQPKLLTQDEKLKVKVNYTESNEILSFELTDGNGYIYIFSEQEITTSTLVTIPHLRDNSPTAPEHSYPQTNISAWHLTEIRATNGERLVKFDYFTSIENYDTPWSRTTYYLNNANTFTTTGALDNPDNIKQFRPTSVESYYIMNIQTKKLIKIKFKDDSVLSFILSAEDSHPETKGVYLDKIQLKKSETSPVSRNFKFNYSNSPFNYPTNLIKRLWLAEVVVNNDKYKLKYYNEYDLPDVELKRPNAQMDGWGYNNGDYRSNDNFGFNVYEHESIKTGLLTHITFPTGGVKQFNWEPHTFSYEGSTLIDNFDNNPLNTTTQQLTNYYTLTKTSTPTFTFTLDSDQYIDVSINNLNISGSTSPLDDFDITQMSSYEIVFSAQGGQQSVSLDKLPKKVRLSPGIYTCKLRIKQLVYNNYTVSGYINIRYTTKKTVDQYKSYLLGGGVRINNIEFKESIDATTFLKKTSYYYNTSEFVDSNTFPHTTPYYKMLSSGSVDARLGSMYKSYDLNDLKYIFMSAERNPGALSPWQIGYDVTTTEINAHLTKGNYIGYKNVRVTEHNDMFFLLTPDGNWNTPNGYTEYEYSTAKDHPSPENTYHKPYFPPPNLDFKRGLLLRKTIFDKNRNKIEETLNDIQNGYNYIEENVSYTIKVNEIACAWRQFYEQYEKYFNADAEPDTAEYQVLCPPMERTCITDYGNCGPAAPYGILRTTVTAGRAELKESIKREFFYNGTTVDSIDTKYTYNYNPHNYQLSEETQHVKEGNVTNLYKTKYFYPVDDNSYNNTSLFTQEEKNVITAMKNNYNMINKPVITTTYKNNQVLQNTVNKYKIFSSSTPLPAGAASLPNYPLLYQVESIKKYGTLPAEDRLIYKLYDRSGNPLEFSMADGMNVCYIWGYYKTVPIAKIENATYDEIRIALSINTTDNVMALNENNMAQINNLRTLLPKAMVTTLVYDVINGVTAVTDPKGYTTNYIYDNLGRLAFVTDHNNNIISKNNYNYRP